MKVRPLVAGLAVAAVLGAAALVWWLRPSTPAPADPGASAPRWAELTEVTDFGADPSGLKMYVYVPTSVGERPPIVVGVHWCHGDAPRFHSGTRFAALADKYGYVVVYPS